MAQPERAEVSDRTMPSSSDELLVQRTGEFLAAAREPSQAERERL